MANVPSSLKWAPGATLVILHPTSLPSSLKNRINTHVEKCDWLEEKSRDLRFREKISWLEGGNVDKEDLPCTASLGAQEDFSWVSPQSLLKKLSSCCRTMGIGQPNQPQEWANLAESHRLPALPVPGWHQSACIGHMDNHSRAVGSEKFFRGNTAAKEEWLNWSEMKSSIFQCCAKPEACWAVLGLSWRAGLQVLEKYRSLDVVIQHHTCTSTPLSKQTVQGLECLIKMQHLRKLEPQISGLRS